MAKQASRSSVAGVNETMAVSFYLKLNELDADIAKAEKSFDKAGDRIAKTGTKTGVAYGNAFAGGFRKFIGAAVLINVADNAIGGLAGALDPHKQGVELGKSLGVGLLNGFLNTVESLPTGKNQLSFLAALTDTILARGIQAALPENIGKAIPDLVDSIGARRLLGQNRAERAGEKGFKIDTTETFGTPFGQATIGGASTSPGTDVVTLLRQIATNTNKSAAVVEGFR